MTDKKLLQQVLDAWQDHWVNDQQGRLLEMIYARLNAPEPKPVDDKEMIRRVRALLPEVAVKATEEPIGKKKEWQGLTDDDVGTVSDEFLEGVLWAEAKLKEKNT